MNLRLSEEGGPMDVRRAQKLFVQFLRDNNLKVTKERLMLVEELLTSEGHLDADSLLFQIRQRGKKASRATVYRTLELMVQAGLARKSRLGREHYVYEKVTPGQRHDHMVCVRCGRIIEFFDPELEERQRKLCEERGFTPTYFALQIQGVCADCRKEN
jgi:Fur family ferric uptake transcriptional regulator